MKPTWIIEEKVFSDTIYNNLLSDLTAEGNPFHTIKVVPFVHEIDGETPDITIQPVVCYGSIGIQKVARKNNWRPGVWTSNAFSVTNYRDRLGNLFLNSDAKLCPIKNLDKITIQMPENDFVFIRPNLDTKEFAGEVIDRANLVTWYENMKRIGYLDEQDFNIITAKPKIILEEYRVIIVNGKIVTWSTYKKYGQAYQAGTIKTGALAVAMQATVQFNPADVFVIDIAQTDNGYKVIEYNTFNSAGLYRCNTRKIVKAINELYE
jgi:hypothetical protein